MVSAEQLSALMQGPPSPPKLQLKKWEEPWPQACNPYPVNPKTPSEWWSKHFLRQAKTHGTPFLEHVEPIGDGFNRIDPISINVDFFGAILGGDRRLGHKVVYIESELQFYYYDPRDHLYKSVSEDKLGNLMRALMVRCAEELGNDVGKWKLFEEYRSDKTIRSIVHRAKSILAADDSFFSAESKNERKQGPELYSRVARTFVEQVLERQAGETLLLTDAFAHFCQFLQQRTSMPPVSRCEFKKLVPPAIQELLDVKIRNDIQDVAGGGSKRGWRGIRALDLEAVGQHN